MAFVAYKSPEWRKKPSYFRRLCSQMRRSEFPAAQTADLVCNQAFARLLTSFTLYFLQRDPLRVVIRGKL